jgi:hypothetical protein
MAMKSLICIKKFIIHALFFVATVLLTIQCKPGYTSPNSSIQFNRDTLKFDTIVAQIGSPTYKSLRLKNKSNQNTEHISLSLAGGDNSYFSININGEPGPIIESLSLRGNDSLFIFAKVKKTDDLPFPNGIHEISDNIIVKSGDYAKTVIITCYLINAEVKTGEIKEFTWGQNQHILIENDALVPENHTLKIEPGCTIYFNNEATLTVEGSLHAKGNCDNPITFRSYRLDNLTSRVSYDQVPCKWGGIRLKSQSNDNIIENCIIQNAITGIQLGEPGKHGTKLHLSKSEMLYNSAVNLLSYNSEITMDNCILSNADQQIILYGGNIRMLHCTLANYNEWREGFGKHAIKLNEQDSLATDYSFGPLIVKNSIIYGPNYNEISVPSDEITQYFEFTSSIVKTQKQVAGTIDKNPQFEKTEFYNYDFHLSKGSPAIDAGEMIESTYQETDMECNPRENHPDIGALEFKE